MAKINKSILGILNGKLGDVVFFQRNGKTYVRSLGVPRKSTITIAQQQQRARFRIVADFLSTLKDLVKITFSKNAKRMTAMNEATAWIYKNGLKKDPQHFALDYPNILVSKGDLYPAANPVAFSMFQGTIDFGWTNNSDGYRASPEDRSILVAHCPSLNKTIFTISDSTRSGCFATLKAYDFEGQEVHTWIAFINGEKLVSNSEYAGQVSVR